MTYENRHSFGFVSLTDIQPTQLLYLLIIESQGANRAKNDMSPDEFVNLCKKVLKHAGYTVIPPSS